MTSTLPIDPSHDQEKLQASRLFAAALPPARASIAVLEPPPTTELSATAVAQPAGAPRIADEYVVLKRLVAARGLLDKQPRYYLAHGSVLAAILAFTVLCIAFSTTTGLRLLCAVPAAFLFGQLGFLGHDAAHGQIFRTSRRNHVLSLLLFNLCLGGSRAWWADKHNRHHSFPNQVGRDPDTEFAMLALSRGQSLEARGIARKFMRFQADAVIPLLFFEAWNIHFHSARFLASKRLGRITAEVALLVVHYAVYVAGILLLFGVSTGLAFIAIQQSLLGLYLSVAFITNHIGMRTLEADEAEGFLRRQVATSRNIRPNGAADFLFGSLTCQIEHHLFPAMPRNRLRAAAPIVRDFCRERGIAYHETGLLRAYGEVRRHLTAMAPSFRIPQS